MLGLTKDSEMNKTVRGPSGLSSAEAQSRLELYGPNVLPETPSKPLWRRFIRQFHSPLIYVLLLALVIDLFIWVFATHGGIPFESLAIALILFLNAGLGVCQESKAEMARAKLKAMSESMVWVLRNSCLTQLSATALVPGDIVRVEAGDRIPADAILTDAQGVAVDQSVLTGESLPIEKEISDEVFSGTLITRGKVFMEITQTGCESAAGKLAVMIGRIEPEKSA
jgi:Ca2+-transporting ATPase